MGSKLSNGNVYMQMIQSFVFIHLTIFLNVPISSSGHNTTEQRENDKIVLIAWKNLLHGYNKHMRPNYTGQPTQVTIDLSILSFGEINEKDMTFSMDIFLRQHWVDYRLTHNLTYPITPLLGKDVPADWIWIPDTAFKNSVKSRKHYVTVTNEKLDIYPNGRIFIGTRVSVIASCRMNFKDYPLDRQICHFVLESYTYPINHLLFTWNDKIDHPVHMSGKDMAQFAITDSKISVDQTVYDTGNYSALISQFLFERRLSVSIIQIFFPATSIVCVSWVSFFLHRNCVGARISFGITTLLTLSYLWSSVNSRSPKVSYIKAVDNYFMVAFSFILLSLLEYTIVMNSDFRKKKAKKLGRSRKHCSVTSRRILNPQVTISDKENDSMSSEQIPLSSRITKKKFFDVQRKHVQKHVVDIDNRGRVSSVIYSTKELLSNQNVVEMAVSKPTHSNENSPSKLDSISRLLFPLSFFAYNIYFWAHVCKGVRTRLGPPYLIYDDEML